MIDTATIKTPEGWNMRFRRDLKKSFLVIEGAPSAPEFEERMLRANRFDHLLDFSTVEMEGCTQFWYDITGKKTLRDYVAQSGLDAALIVRLLREIQTGTEELRAHLISRERVPMSPEMIYVDVSVPSPVWYLCYCPVPPKKQMPWLLPLTQLFVEAADPGKETLSEACFEMHTAAAGPDGSLRQMVEICERHFPSESAFLAPVDEEEASGGRRLALYQSEVPAGAEEMEGVVSNPDEAVWEAPAEGGWISRVAGRFRRMARQWQEGPRVPESVAFPVAYQPTPVTALVAETATVCSGRLIYEGTGAGQDYVVDRKIFRIGSEPSGNEAVLQNPGVSRYHARICRRDGRFYLEDLNSKNGTVWNGQALAYHQSVPLAAGDHLRFGSERYRVE